MTLLETFKKLLQPAKPQPQQMAVTELVTRPVVINPALTLSEAEQVKVLQYRLKSILLFLDQHDNIDPVKLEHFRHEVHGLVPQLIKFGHGSWQDLTDIVAKIDSKGAA